MAISFNNLRVGHNYKLINYGESTEFEVLEIHIDGNCKIKDLLTLEKYYLNDLIQFGKGKDYNLYEI